MATAHAGWRDIDVELSLVMEEFSKFQETGRLLLHTSLEGLMHDIVRLYQDRQEAFFSIEHFPVGDDQVHVPVAIAEPIEPIEPIVPIEPNAPMESVHVPFYTQTIDANEAVPEIPDTLDVADVHVQIPQEPISRPGSPSPSFQVTDMFSGKAPSDDWRTNAAPVDLIVEETDVSHDMDRATLEYKKLSDRILNDIAHVKSKLTSLNQYDD